ncbi:MAG: glycogen/starch synthase [Bacteroidales bacterium]|nr:glycogen/starch synthase [Bacteroidales bacterium]MBN2817646.1 glycogen/starch synthase [Bacteroidales bacterium]
MTKRILFVSQEITPYLPETEMSVIARNLPQGIQERGKEIRTFMPRFGCINERRNQLHEVIRLSGMNLIIDDNDHPLIIKVASIQAARMQVYFIDNEDFFQRKYTLQDKTGNFFEDNDERAIFFTRGVVETVKKLQWAPDLIHCHGWFTSLLPIYIKQYYHDDPLFQNTKMVSSIYDTEFTSALNSRLKEKLSWDGINKKDLDVITNPTYTNFVKLGVNFSDGVIFGSEKVNPEIADYVKKLPVPQLDYKSEEEYLDAYSAFYDELLG